MNDVQQHASAALTASSTPAPAPPNPYPRWLRVLRDRVLSLLLLPLFSDAGLWLLRAACPILRVRLGNFALVTRYEHVHEVLTHDRIFHVEGDRVRRLNRGESFLLGLQDGDEYRRYQRLVMSLFRLEDIQQRVASFAAARSRAIVASAVAPFDAVRGLITAIPIDIVRDYYGVAIDPAREDELAEDTFLVSKWLFDPRESTPGEEARAVVAGERINQLVERAIAAVRSAGAAAPDTILARLLALQARERDLSDAHVRVIMVGMIMGFVPTNTMAGGHILDVLLTRRDAMERARAAACAGDDERLRRCLFEAMRFQPLLREPFRICSEDYTLGDGTAGAKRIKRGTRVLPITRSAMFDPRHVERPRAFDPDRPAHHFMLFGHGLHRCIGAAIAEAQITHTFKPLLQQRNLRRAAGASGKLSRSGPFPRHLQVEFEREDQPRDQRSAAAGVP